MWKPVPNNNSFHQRALAAIWHWQCWVTADLVFSVSWYQVEPCQFAPVESLSLNGADYPDFYSGAEKVAAAVLHILDFNLLCLSLLVLSLEECVRRTSLLVLRQSFFPFLFSTKRDCSSIPWNESHKTINYTSARSTICYQLHLPYYLRPGGKHTSNHPLPPGRSVLY